MKILNNQTLSDQYTRHIAQALHGRPYLEDRGDGQATLDSLVTVQRCVMDRWPSPARLRDNGATLRAMQEVATGIDAYRMAGDAGARPDVMRATQAAGWLACRLDAARSPAPEQTGVGAAIDSAAGPDDVVIGGRGDGPVTLAVDPEGERAS